MPVFFRQTLVMLLVLLQYAAPVVHAHTGNDNDQRGLHLYEFEILHFSSAIKLMKSVDVVPDTESNIVNIGSAIKQQLKHVYPDNLIEITSYPSISPINFNFLVIAPHLTPPPTQCNTTIVNGCRAPPA